MSGIAPMMEPRHASVDVARTVYNNKDVSKFRTCYDYAGMDVVQETGSRTSSYGVVTFQLVSTVCANHLQIRHFDRDDMEFSMKTMSQTLRVWSRT